MIRCLSIQQPWSWLIANGIKDIENRDWTTGYRGLILIHAGKQVDVNALPRLHENHQFCLNNPHWHAAVAHMPKSERDYETGGIVGYATLNDVVTTSKSPWFRGRYGFVLTDQHPVPFIPLRGQLGLFDVPTEVVEQVLLKMAEQDSDHMDGLLQAAIEQLDEARATLLLDRVHQIFKEGLQDVQGWK